MKTVIEMAREASMNSPDGFKLTVKHMAIFQLEKFAALVEAAARAAERERIAKWYESEGHMMFPVAIPDAIRSNT